MRVVLSGWRGSLVPASAGALLVSALAAHAVGRDVFVGFLSVADVVYMVVRNSKNRKIN